MHCKKKQANISAKSLQTPINENGNSPQLTDKNSYFKYPLKTIISMKKAQIIIVVILLASVLAGIFGALNNQITYFLSPEFYTKSLFPQFGFVEYGLNTPKITAAIIGVWSTWWVGLLIGTVISFTSLIHSTSFLMIRAIRKSFLIIISSAVVFGFLGYLFGVISLNDTLINFGFKGTQEQLKSFITVGYIHDFEYLGGLISLIIAVIFQIKNKKELTKSHG